MIQCVCWPLCVAYLSPERFQKLLCELLCTFSRRPYARRTTIYTQAYRSIERSGREPVLQQSLPPWSLMISFEFRDLLSTDGGSANRFMTDLYVCIAAKASKSKAAARLSCDSTLAWDGVPVSIHAAGLGLLGHSSASAHPVALEMLGHASASAPPAGLARPPSTLSFQDEAGNSGIAKPLPRTACEGARPDAQPPPGPHSVSSDSCECKLYWKPSPLLGHSSRKHLATCASWPRRLEICRVDFLDGLICSQEQVQLIQLLRGRSRRQNLISFGFFRPSSHPQTKAYANHIKQTWLWNRMQCKELALQPLNLLAVR